jgi:hypothetical protein
VNVTPSVVNPVRYGSTTTELKLIVVNVTSAAVFSVSLLKMFRSAVSGPLADPAVHGFDELVQVLPHAVPISPTNPNMEIAKFFLDTFSTLLGTRHP